MSNFKGSFGDALRPQDYQWLLKHKDLWLNDTTVVYLEVVIATPKYYSMGLIHKTGPNAYSGTWSRNWGGSGDNYGPQNYTQGWTTGYSDSSTSVQMYYVHTGNNPYPQTPLIYSHNGNGFDVDPYDTLGISLVPDSDPYNYDYDADSLITLRSLHFNIFDKLKNYCNFITNPEGLNSLYIGDRSGNKYASELVLAQLDSTGQIDADGVDNLARIANTKYSENWLKLYNTLSFEYDPLENYHRTEVNSESDSDVETPLNWKKTDTSLAADNIETESNSVYGFNSSDPVPDTENERTFAHKNDSEQSGTYTTTHNYGKKVETYGNIGVTTSQQMLESERNVLEWNFWEKVFNDLDSILTKNFIGGIN